LPVIDPLGVDQVSADTGVIAPAKIRDTPFVINLGSLRVWTPGVIN
jgi:hypothetical protein